MLFLYFIIKKKQIPLASPFLRGERLFFSYGSLFLESALILHSHETRKKSSHYQFVVFLFALAVHAIRSVIALCWITSYDPKDRAISHKCAHLPQSSRDLITMANQSHVQMLLQGVSVWNRWRAAHPEIWPDLSGAYLTGADLPQADLIEADLRGADLTQASLHAADLTKADLEEADLTRATLIKADLTRAEFNEADLSGVNLTKANLTNAVLRGAKLVNADLSEATCVGADLTGADMTGADTTGAIFELP